MKDLLTIPETLESLSATTPQTPFTEAELQEAATQARGAWSANTQRAYASSWADFERWCSRRGRHALPADPDTVLIYLGWAAEHGAEGDKPLGLASVEMRASAISWRHRVAGLVSPTLSGRVKLALQAIRNRKGRAPSRVVAPAIDSVLEKLLTMIDRTTSRGKRDAAVLLVGRNGAFRRSEITNLNMEHLRKIDGGYALDLAKSKTDQEGVGLVSALARVDGPLCPVAALDQWLDVRGLASGPVFRSISNGGAILENRLPARAVARIVQVLAKRAGVNLDLSGHSLRAGFVTQAINDGASITEIQAQTHHKRIDTLLGYYRRENPLQGNAVKNLGRKKDGR